MLTVVSVDGSQPAPSAAPATTSAPRAARAGAAPAVPAPWWLAIVLAVGGGVAGFLAFPRFSLWWLAPVCLALLITAVRGRGPRAAAAIGYVHGWAMLAPLLNWTSIQVGPVPWLALTGLEAVFHAAAAAAISVCLRLPNSAARWATVAGCWVGAEALQGRVPFGGFAWSKLAFTQADAPTIGLAAIGGAPLVSFAVALAGAGLAETVRRVAAGPRPGRRWATRAGQLAVIGLVLASGLLVPLPTAAQDGVVRVAGIQGSVPKMGLDFNAKRRAVLDKHAQLTREFAAQVQAGTAPPPDLVVWPENASDIDPFANPDAFREIDAAVTAIGATTLVGTLVANAETGLIRNTVLAWQPGQGPTQRYAKRAPVPFAEYVPYRDFFRAITPLVDQAGHFEAGDTVGMMTLPTPHGTVRAGILICFEVVPDRLVADVIDADANLLVVPTNNATFGFTDESRQQLAISRLRAVETGRAVAHVSTVGVSAIIAPDGTPLASSTLFNATILQADVPLRSSLTVASRLRSGPEWALTLLALLGIAAGARIEGPPRRGRRPNFSPRRNR